MSARKRHAFVFILFLVSTAASAAPDVPLTSRSVAIVSSARPLRPVTTIAEPLPTVRPQPAPAPPPAASVPSRAQPAPSPSLNRSAIDLAQIRANKVVALSNGRAELVDEASVAAQIERKEVLVDRTNLVARAVSLPGSLRTRLEKSGPASAGASQGLQLSYRVSAFDTSPERKLVHLNPFLIDLAGLLFDAKEHEYVGTVVVALLDESNRDAAGGLDPAVSVLFSGKGAVLEPHLAKFDHYGPNAPQEVTVRLREPPASSFLIAASADFGASYNYAELAVSRPRVEVLLPDPPTIAGWGIGKATLHVQVTDVVSPEQFQITFAGDTVGVDPNPVHFDRSGVGAFEWRSHGTGSSTIRVDTPGIAVQPVTLSFTVPWVFLLLAASGGLVGAFLRGRGRDRWPKALSIGALSAVLMVVAYALGLGRWVETLAGGNASIPAGEAAIVVLGAMAALGGVSLLVPKTQE